MNKIVIPSQMKREATVFYLLVGEHPGDGLPPSMVAKLMSHSTERRGVESTRRYIYTKIDKFKRLGYIKYNVRSNITIYEKGENALEYEKSLVEIGVIKDLNDRSSLTDKAAGTGPVYNDLVLTDLALFSMGDLNKLIAKENLRMLDKWGFQTFTANTWLNFILEEVGEFAKAMSEHRFRGGSVDDVVSEGIQSATLILKLVEMYQNKDYSDLVRGKGPYK